MRVYLGAYWRKRPIYLGQFIETLQQFLQELGSFHPVFTNLSEIGGKPNAEIATKEDWSNFTAIALERAWNDTVPLSRHTHLDQNNKPTLATVSRTGFHLHFQNDGYNKRKCLGTYISVSAGATSPYLNSAVVIHLPTTQYPEFAEVDFVSRLYQIVEKHWQPNDGLVSSENFRDLTYSQERTTIAAVGWLSYVTDKTLLAGVPPEFRQIACANGSLVVTSEELSSAENPEHVSRAMILRDILQKPLPPIQKNQ
jgi:hypothetical protein